MSLALERRVLVQENKAGANSLTAVQFASRGQSCRRAAALTDGLCHLALIPQKMIGLNWSARFPTTGMPALMSGARAKGLARIPVPSRLKGTGRRKGDRDGAAMATKQETGDQNLDRIHQGSSGPDVPAGDRLFGSLWDGCGGF